MLQRTLTSSSEAILDRNCDLACTTKNNQPTKIFFKQILCNLIYQNSLSLLYLILKNKIYNKYLSRLVTERFDWLIILRGAIFKNCAGAPKQDVHRQIKRQMLSQVTVLYFIIICTHYRFNVLFSVDCCVIFDCFSISKKFKSSVIKTFLSLFILINVSGVPVLCNCKFLKLILYNIEFIYMYKKRKHTPQLFLETQINQ